MSNSTSRSRMAVSRIGDPLADPLRLDNQLCFALYAATHAMTRAYRPLLGELGLTYPQYLVLLVLWETDRQTVSELGGKLRLDSGTLTPVLKRLERAALVRRTRRREDERETEVALTDKGRELQTSAYGVRETIVCRLGISEAEIAALRGDLNRLLLTLGRESGSDACDDA